MLELLLPQLAFVELCFHRLARRAVRETAHEKKGVRIIDGEEWTEDLHADFDMGGNGSRVKNPEELGPHPRLCSIRAHLDDGCATIRRQSAWHVVRVHGSATLP